VEGGKRNDSLLGWPVKVKLRTALLCKPFVLTAEAIVDIFSSSAPITQSTLAGFEHEDEQR